MGNGYIMQKAAEVDDPLLRLCHLAAFSVAQYGLTMNRVSKPFNPILGETFEYVGDNWKLVAEQVSHHPPVSAIYVKSAGYDIRMNTSMSTHFWGKSLEFKPCGLKHYNFHDNNDHYVVHRPISACRNIIFGTMYIDHYGKMTIKNTRTGDECTMEFHKAGKSMFGKSKNGSVEGEIKDADGNIHYYIQGKWNDHIYMSPVNPDKKGFDENNLTILWQAETTPENWEQIYRFTKFALQLNKITPSMRKSLPPTDSRLRTDQRALENGDLTLANTEKHRLEEKQRGRRKKREKEVVDWKPNYFEEYIDPDTGTQEFKLIRDYWEDSKNQDWSHLPDLFGEEEEEEEIIS